MFCVAGCLCVLQFLPMQFQCKNKEHQQQRNESFYFEFGVFIMRIVVVQLYWLDRWMIFCVFGLNSHLYTSTSSSHIYSCCNNKCFRIFFLSFLVWLYFGVADCNDGKKSHRCGTYDSIELTILPFSGFITSTCFFSFFVLFLFFLVRSRFDSFEFLYASIHFYLSTGCASVLVYVQFFL